MRIAFLASTYPRFTADGSGRFVLSIAEAVHNLGHEVHVLAPYHPSVGELDSPVPVHHFRYAWSEEMHIMGHAGAMNSDRSLKGAAIAIAPLFYLSALRRLGDLHRQFHFDALHVHWVIPNGPIAARIARRAGIPLIVTLHGSDVFFALHNPLFKQLARGVFRQAVAVSACSPDLVDGALKLGASPEKTHLIPWGADPALFAHPPASSLLLSQRLALPPDSPVILSLSRLVRKKGIDVLVRALPDVLARHSAVRLVIAGDGPEQEPLTRLAAELGVSSAVTFAGRLRWDEVPAALHMCDIFAVPSVHDERGNLDGLPTTILEAMAAGKPLVASRVAGIPLAVTHGQSGLLVPESDPKALAAALNTLLDDPALARSYGANGRQRVEQELNWRNVAVQFANFYRLSAGV